MGITIANQTSIFFSAMIVGAVLGVCYDFFRILRVAVPSSRKVILIEDILFFLFATVLIFLYFLNQNKGEVRIAYLAGVLLGWILYYFTFGVMILSVSSMLIKFIKKVVRVIMKPFLWVGRILGTIINKLKTKYKKYKIPLKSKLLLMYNKNNNNKKKKNKKSEELSVDKKGK